MDIEIIPVADPEAGVDAQGRPLKWIYQLWIQDRFVSLGQHATGPEAIAARDRIYADIVHKRAFVVKDHGPRDRKNRYRVWKLCLADAQTAEYVLPDGSRLSPGCPADLYCTCIRTSQGALIECIAQHADLAAAQRDADTREKAFRTPMNTTTIDRFQVDAVQNLDPLPLNLEPVVNPPPPRAGHAGDGYRAPLSGGGFIEEDEIPY